MEHEETGCQPSPEAPILCINNCGFFGSAANMYMCSKCYKDMILKQEQAKLAASSINKIVNGSSSGSKKEATIAGNFNMQSNSFEVKGISLLSSNASSLSEVDGKEGKEARNRCSTCKKRVGLTGFTCRCGNLFCGSHRYSDKHDCPIDYQAAAQDVIAKSNPVVKGDKLKKI